MFYTCQGRFTLKRGALDYGWEVCILFIEQKQDICVLLSLTCLSLLQNLRQRWVKATTCQPTEVITGQTCFMQFSVLPLTASRDQQFVPSNWPILRRHSWGSSRDKSPPITTGFPFRTPTLTETPTPAFVSMTPIRSRNPCWTLSNHTPWWTQLSPVLEEVPS